MSEETMPEHVMTMGDVEEDAEFSEWLRDECFTCFRVDDHLRGYDAVVLGHLHADGHVVGHDVIWSRYRGEVSAH